MEREAAEMQAMPTETTVEQTTQESTLENFNGITTNTTWLGEDIRDPHDSFRGGEEDF